VIETELNQNEEMNQMKQAVKVNQRQQENSDDVDRRAERRRQAQVD